MLLACLTPILFTCSNLQAKYFTGPACKHDSWKLSFGSFAFVGFFLMLGLLYRALSNPETYSPRLLIIGTAGSIINTLGLVLMSKACSLGPLGPISALGCIQNVLFSAVQAFILSKVPLPLEFFGSAIGIFGALVLTIPEKLMALGRCLISCGKSRE